MRRSAALLILGLIAMASCRSAVSDGRTVVASFYPLAYAAERIAGPDWRVIDLTPPGTEAHDVELSLDQRAELEAADAVLYLGDLGFQPQVEQAVEDASGEVVAVADGLPLRAGHDHEEGEGSGAEGEHEEATDPHVWLDPELYRDIVSATAEALVRAHREGADGYRRRARELIRETGTVADQYRSVLASCRYRTLIVPHEAFGYLVERYGLEQVGLAGLSPEGEPTADRLREADALVERGAAGAVFYEPTAEGERVGRQVAEDLGVRALPLSPIESRPPTGDFLAALSANLESLRKGLGCR